MTSSLTSPAQTFLQSTAITDSTNIIDITKAPYNVPLAGGTNDTTAIQNAINAAKTAGNGAIVYLPMNGYGYDISSPLSITGSNYTIQGSGLYTELLWTGGTTSGTMFAVSNPQNITIEQLEATPANGTTDLLVDTASGASELTLDGFYGYYSNGEGPGVVLSSLPSGSVVYSPHLDTPITVNDCGPANILIKYLCMQQVTVQGATHAKSGFVGAVISEGGQQTTTDYNITVNDNQDLVMGDYYDEQTYNDLNLQRGSGTWTGRVTIQGFKEQANANSTQINVNNYAGRLMYGPQAFTNNSTNTVITQSGTNPVDLILQGDVFNNGTPSISKGSGGNLIEAANLYLLGGTTTYMTNVPNPLTAANLASMSASFDHLRKLGATNLAMDYGLLELVANPVFEADTPNSNPTTTLGYTPAGWVVTGSTAIGGGVRNATVVSGTASSPFGPGNQSVLMVDTTGTSTGSVLVLYQNTPTVMPASEGAVFTFDFRINGTATAHNDNWIGIFAGSTRCSYIHVSGNSTSGTITANVNGKDSGFGAPALAVNTWYRVRVVLGAPNAGKSNATLWLTEWGGTPASYTIDGVPSTLSSGYSEAYLKQVAAGEAITMNVDNIMIQNGTFDFPHLP